MNHKPYGTTDAYDLTKRGESATVYGRTASYGRRPCRSGSISIKWTENDAQGDGDDW